jgi:hypothetical protein
MAANGGIIIAGLFALFVDPTFVELKIKLFLL